ncbi:MAG: hypothetical protein HY528_03855 [Chloroflexi bacterium]|nr:hypothetical protein [Chloroflexota bacterium]
MKIKRQAVRLRSLVPIRRQSEPQAGQAFILVLILLAIGALLVVPSLRFSGSSLKNSQIVTRQTRELYAADAAQEYVMWKLLYNNYASTFTYNGQSDNFSVDVCGIPVKVSVIMRAVVSWHGVTLSTDDVIKPTKSVSPTTNSGSSQTYTYTIALEQISDNISQGLNAIYDVLPDAFKSSSYVAGSSKWSEDGGTTWQTIGDPSLPGQGSNPSGSYGGQVRLRWPYSGNFTSPARDFYSEQVKKMSFQVNGTMGPNTKNYNWVVLAPWNTLSGAQSPITRDTGTSPKNGLLNVFKTADKAYIPPDVPTTINYTINIQSQEQSTDKITKIDDYLPPGFSYTNNSTGGITTSNPISTFETINGVQRWHLNWTFSGSGISIASGTTLYLTFSAIGTESASGSYYNEMLVTPSNPLPQIFSDLGMTYSDFNSSYTWNSAAVLVPAYDSSTSAGGTTTNANLALGTNTVGIFSYQVK